MYPTANSTPTGLPTSSNNPSFFGGQTKLPTTPVQTPMQNQTSMYQAYNQPAGPALPKTDVVPTQMYSPEMGPTTQKTADTTYAEKILNGFSSADSMKVPSTAISGSSNLSSASAKRSSYESLLQSYLDQQKQFQDRYMQTLAPTAEETALASQLAQQRTQAALNQETALNSGETSSFAGGEAQRVARTDAIKQAGVAAQLEVLQSRREQSAKQLEFLINSGDQSFKTQLQIRQLENEVSGIDKQAQDTFFNLQQTNPDIEFSYDPTKTPVENLQEFRKQIASQPSELSLSNRQSRINSIVSEFGSNPVVKRYQTVSEGYDFIKSLQDRLKSGQPLTSADNIGVLYAFAKIMDPDSAVREGEYDTIQKYAQSWSQAFGLKANRILNNEQFLTNEAISNLTSVIEAKYNSINKSFQNTQSEYNRKIEEAKLGSLGGSIVDYSKPFNKSGQEQTIKEGEDFSW